MEQLFVGAVVVCMLVGIFFVPFGLLANSTYQACYKTKPSLGVAICHFIPFYNYIVIRKYLYGKALVAVIPCILTGICLGFRFVALFVWSSSNPWMMLVSVYASIAGFILWYITMAFTACYTAILTRRGIATIIIGTIIPFLGAFIVSKNIVPYFKAALEANSEFRVDN